MEMDKQTPKEELKSLSPLLEKLKPRMRGPEQEAYFENMQTKVLERIGQGVGGGQKSIRSWKGMLRLPLLTYKTAVAAAVVFFILWRVIPEIQYHTGDSRYVDGLTENEMIRYLELSLDDVDLESYAVLFVEDQSDFEISEESVILEELLQQLDEIEEL